MLNCPLKGSGFYFTFPAAAVKVFTAAERVKAAQSPPSFQSFLLESSSPVRLERPPCRQMAKVSWNPCFKLFQIASPHLSDLPGLVPIFVCYLSMGTNIFERWAPRSPPPPHDYGTLEGRQHVHVASEPRFKINVCIIKIVDTSRHEHHTHTHTHIDTYIDIHMHTYIYHHISEA